MVSNLSGYSCSHGIFRSVGMFYYMLHNDIGSYVSNFHGIDSGEHSSEPSMRNLCHRKYINVAWHYCKFGNFREGFIFRCEG